MTMIEIDGSYGEGGGQVLRSALTLSALTGQSTHIRCIRAGRRNPGLAPQHLTNVLALAQVCDAEVQGATIGSKDVIFRPCTEPRPGDYVFDVGDAAQGGSAGSVTLMLQTLLLPLAFASANSRLILKGGTHAHWSPPFEYVSQVYLPTVARMGVKAECHIEKLGFYPVGGGQISADISTSRASATPNATGIEEGITASHSSIELSPLEILDRGALKRVWGIAICCNLPAHISQRMANRAASIIGSKVLPVDITPQCVRGAGPGAALCLIAEYENALAGFTSLGERGRPSEKIAEEVCQHLLRHHDSGSPVDPHLADQLLLPMALANGVSKFQTSRITRHLLTNAHVIQQFITANIEIQGKEGEAGEVIVDGIAYVGLKNQEPRGDANNSAIFT